MVDTRSILSVISMAVCALTFFLHAINDEQSFAFRCIAGFMCGASAALVFIAVSGMIAACI